MKFTWFLIVALALRALAGQAPDSAPRPGAADFADLYQRGLAALSSGDATRALEAFTAAESLRPDDPNLLVALLQTRINLRQPAEAERVLDRIDSRLAPTDPRRVQIAQLLAAEHANGLAERELRVLEPAQPNSYALSYTHALVLTDRRRYDAAAAHIARALQLRDTAEAENLSGRIEEGRGHYAAAIAAYGRAARIEGNAEEYQFDYATSLLQHGDPAVARQQFADATRRFPGSIRVWLGLGAAQYVSGDYPGASKTLLHAADLAPSDPHVYYTLGRIYDAAGEAQPEITARFKRYLDQDGHDAWARLFYARMLAAGGADANEVEPWFRKAIVLSPNFPEAHLELGKWLLSQHRAEAAARELELAEQQMPASAETAYQLARVYRNLGRTREAKVAERRFAELRARSNQGPVSLLK